MSQTIPELLQTRFLEAMHAMEADLPEDFTPEIVPTADPKFGDYQCNSAMSLAKVLRTNPRQFATQVLEHLKVNDLCEEPSMAGPGFINLKLKPEAIAKRLLALASDDHLGVPQVAEPKTIVVDFSAPNVAKQMHVGHIRSTIIGDCLARVARFMGHKVITDNHIGDWGTQFGMVIYGWKHLINKEALESDGIAELLRVYKDVNSRIKAEEEENSDALMTQCREELVKLQQGDAENLAIWKECVKVSLDGLAGIYDQLDIHFDHFLGESFFNDALAPLVEDMLAKGQATESDGAICIFSDGTLPPEEDPFLIQRDGEWEPSPALIRKSDGGFLYATTDLATIDYRANEWQAEEVWYVVGAPQQKHFSQVFEAAKRRGHNVKLVHVSFGSILGKDRKPFKTRSGGNVGLLEVLNESVERSLAFLNAREEEDDRFVLPEKEKEDVAEIIGIGSVKYAELSQARMTDYVFDWDTMLSLKGNTAPYLMNSYVRTRGIFRKLEEAFEAPTAIEITEDGERTLAMNLLRFGEAVPQVLRDYKPNVLANYLYDLARSYHAFYEACPVLKAEGITRESRLFLCDLTSQVLKQGLTLLGIRVTERM